MPTPISSGGSAARSSSRIPCVDGSSSGSPGGALPSGSRRAARWPYSRIDCASAAGGNPPVAPHRLGLEVGPPLLADGARGRGDRLWVALIPLVELEDVARV